MMEITDTSRGDGMSCHSMHQLPETSVVPPPRCQVLSTLILRPPLSTPPPPPSQAPFAQIDFRSCNTEIGLKGGYMMRSHCISRGYAPLFDLVMLTG